MCWVQNPLQQEVRKSGIPKQKTQMANKQRKKIKTMAAVKGAWVIQQCVAFNLLYQRHLVWQPTAATQRHTQVVSSALRELLDR